jgi:hypothetical protein
MSIQSSYWQFFNYLTCAFLQITSWVSKLNRYELLVSYFTVQEHHHIRKKKPPNRSLSTQTSRSKLNNIYILNFNSIDRNIRIFNIQSVLFSYLKYVNVNSRCNDVSFREATDRPQRSQLHSPHHWPLLQQVGNWMLRDPQGRAASAGTCSTPY